MGSLSFLHPPVSVPWLPPYSWLFLWVHRRYLIFKGGCEAVVEHLLVENWGDASRHGWHDPHPVSRTAPTAAVLVLHVLDEGLGGRVVVHNGHFVTLMGE